MKAPRWDWENSREAQFALVDDCIKVLEGNGQSVTPEHIAACADWVLRQHHENRQLRRRLARMNKTIARLCRLAFAPGISCFASLRGDDNKTD